MINILYKSKYCILNKIHGYRKFSKYIIRDLLLYDIQYTNNFQCITLTYILIKINMKKLNSVQNNGRGWKPLVSRL